MSLSEIINIIESVAPLSLQEAWDNSGLQIGNRETEVSSILLCTDISESIVDEAIEKGCQLIISHHPLLFHGLKSITPQTAVARCAIKAIQHHIAIYSSHTAMDSYLHGVSGRMADKIGVKNYHILAESGENVGLGVIGDLPNPMAWEAFMMHIQAIFHAPIIRYTQPTATQVQTVALCGGAGSEFVEIAIAQGADVYISADFKYHEFQQAEGRIAVLDIGHFESEQYTKEIFAELLNTQAPQLKTYLAEADKSLIKVWKAK